jgi:hypothetical protein
MSWHRTPTDDAWKQAHLVMVAPRELADRHGLDMRTPLLTLSRALRCTRCGERKGQARLDFGGAGRQNVPDIKTSPVLVQ